MALRGLRPPTLQRPASRSTCAARPRAGWFDNFGASSQEKKDAAYKDQLEFLAARRSGKLLTSAEKRRKEVAGYMKLSKEEQRAVRASRPENQTPIYEPEPNWLTSIILPVAPFGDPKMDNGERWDLKAKYTDEGYVDEDSDVLAKVRNFFGGGKK